MTLTLQPIGALHEDEEGFYAEVKPQYRPALQGLEGFSYVQLIWWFDGCDNEALRATVTEEKPYVKGPEVLGTFATRSPARPNPLALSCAYVTEVDAERGLVRLAYIDARDGSPLLDIKPYTPSLDRVEDPVVPAWCADWPKNVETSGDFDWESVFNF